MPALTVVLGTCSKVAVVSRKHRLDDMLIFARECEDASPFMLFGSHILSHVIVSQAPLHQLVPIAAGLHVCYRYP